MIINLFWFAAGMLGFAVLKKLGLALAWRFGRRPAILDETPLEFTATDCTAKFEKACSNLTGSQFESLPESERQMMRGDIKAYTRFAIEEYVL